MSAGVQLRDLITGVRAEAGQSLKDSHGQNQRETIKYLLQSVQRRLWTRYDWPLYTTNVDKTFEAEERYINYPDILDPNRINHVSRFWANEWKRLVYGIGNMQYTEWKSDLGEKTTPVRRWDHRPTVDGIQQKDQLGMVELWPIPSEAGTLRFRGHQRLVDFLEDDDLSTLDADMLILYVAGRLLVREQKADGELKIREADNIRRAILGQSGSERDRMIKYGGRSRLGEALRPGLDYVNRVPGQGT